VGWIGEWEFREFDYWISSYLKSITASILNRNRVSLTCNVTILRAHTRASWYPGAMLPTHGTAFISDASHTLPMNCDVRQNCSEKNSNGPRSIDFTEMYVDHF
jgi:hypothetical protein